MKKKLVAMIMTAVMTATLLTACGDAPEANAPGTSSEVPESSAPESSVSESTADSNEQSAAEDPADSNMVSDEVFAVIQENYALMVQYYDAVAAVYNSDEIAADPEIENIMNQAADLIAQMGGIKQDTLTEDDAVALNDLIIGLAEHLTKIVEVMEPAGDAGEAEGTPVTDETFEILQTNWASLADFYNQAAEAYETAVNNGELERDEDFEALMNQAAEILEQIQGVSQDSLTQENAVEINDTMILIQEQMSEALGVELTE